MAPTDLYQNFSRHMISIIQPFLRGLQDSLSFHTIPSFLIKSAEFIEKLAFIYLSNVLIWMCLWLTLPLLSALFVVGLTAQDAILIVIIPLVIFGYSYSYICCQDLAFYTFKILREDDSKHGFQQELSVSTTLEWMALNCQVAIAVYVLPTFARDYVDPYVTRSSHIIHLFGLGLLCVYQSWIVFDPIW